MTQRQKEALDAVSEMRLRLELQNEYLWQTIHRYEFTMIPQFIQGKDGKLTERPKEEYWPQHVLNAWNQTLQLIKDNEQREYAALIKEFPELKYE